MTVTPSYSFVARVLTCLCAVSLCSSCASLHSYQVDDIDSSSGALTPFEVQVDETGFDIHQGMEIGKALVDRRSAKRLNTAEGVIALFQVGPSTGNPTFRDTWADGLVAAIRERCESGRVTGLTTVRESNHYPVVSGERPIHGMGWAFIMAQPCFASPVT